MVSEVCASMKKKGVHPTVFFKGSKHKVFGGFGGTHGQVESMAESQIFQPLEVLANHVPGVFFGGTLDLKSPFGLKGIYR